MSPSVVRRTTLAWTHSDHSVLLPRVRSGKLQRVINSSVQFVFNDPLSSDFHIDTMNEPWTCSTYFIYYAHKAEHSSRSPTTIMVGSHYNNYEYRMACASTAIKRIPQRPEVEERRLPSSGPQWQQSSRPSRLERRHSNNATTIPDFVLRIATLGSRVYPVTQ